MIPGLIFTIVYGKIAERFDPKDFKWFIFVWVIGAIILQLILVGSFPHNFIFFLAIKAGLVYLWLLILNRTQDTIFTNLLILIAGAYLLS